MNVSLTVDAGTSTRIDFNGSRDFDIADPQARKAVNIALAAMRRADNELGKLQALRNGAEQ